MKWALLKFSVFLCSSLIASRLLQQPQSFSEAIAKPDEAVELISFPPESPYTYNVTLFQFTYPNIQKRKPMHFYRVTLDLEQNLRKIGNKFAFDSFNKGLYKGLK